MIHHSVITRHGIDNGSGSPSTHWIANRREILFNLTLTSLLLQSSKNFRWIVLTDEAYAEEERELISAEVKGAFPVDVRGIDGPFIPGQRSGLADLLGINCPQGDVLLTTRLDSDDALGPNFIELCQAEVPRYSGDFIIDFTRGVVVEQASGICFARQYFRSPFQTLVEQGSNRTPRTVMTEGHHLLADFFPYRRIQTRTPMWFASVHGGNLANKTRGWLCSNTIIPEVLQVPLGVRQRSTQDRVRRQVEVVLDYALQIAQTKGKIQQFKSTIRNMIA